MAGASALFDNLVKQSRLNTFDCQFENRRTSLLGSASEFRNAGSVVFRPGSERV